MCYDVQAKLYAQLKRAKRKGYKDLAEILEKTIGEDYHFNHYHAMGFDNPKLFIYTSENPNRPIPANWGFTVPQAWYMGKKHINARGETMYEKPTFKDAAIKGRCLIQVNGFFEHYHHKGKIYPFYVYRKDLEPITLAGISNEFRIESTHEIYRGFTIITSKANQLLSKIHNHPKLNEARMPLILPEEIEDQWLQVSDKSKIVKLVQPFEDGLLAAHPVRGLRGKVAIGNHPNVTNQVNYDVLDLDEFK